MRFWLTFGFLLLAGSGWAQTHSQFFDYAGFNVYWNGTSWTSYAAGYGNVLGTNTSTGDFNFYTTGNAASAGLSRTLTQAAAITAAGTVSSTAVRAYTGSFGNVNATGTITQNGASLGGVAGVPTFKATSGYVGSSTGWPSWGSFFTMASRFDTTNSYNSSTGVFTAPIAGYYVLSFSVTAVPSSSSGDMNDIQLSVNGNSDETIFPAQTNSSPGSSSAPWVNWSYSGPVYLGVGGTVALKKSCCEMSINPSYWRGMFAGYYLHP